MDVEIQKLSGSIEQAIRTKENPDKWFQLTCIASVWYFSKSASSSAAEIGSLLPLLRPWPLPLPRPLPRGRPVEPLTVALLHLHAKTSKS